MRALLLVLVLVACGGDDPAGTWVITDAEFTENPCGLDGDLLPSGNLSITADSQVMELDFGDGRPELECSRDNSKFTCAEIVVETDRQRDALLSTYLATQGTTGEQIDGTRTGAIVCEGGDCTDLGNLGGFTWPCAIELSFTAQRGDD